MIGSRIRVVVGTLLFLIVVFASSYGWAIAVSDLVDEFIAATDVQRDKMITKYIDEKASATGVVENVKDFSTFNEKIDKGALYYQVVLTPQKTALGNAYQVSFFYKTADEVKNIAKTQQMTEKGAILKIVDERLWISIWLYVGTLGPEEKTMFGEHGMLPKK